MNSARFGFLVDDAFVESSLTDKLSAMCGSHTCTMGASNKPDAMGTPNDPLSHDKAGERPLFLADDIGDDASSTATISVGSTLSSSIQSLGDLDYIRVSLVGGQTYTFSVDRSSGALDPFVELRTANGAVVGAGLSDDDGGMLTNSLLMYRPTTTGDYFVVVRSWADQNGGSLTTGNYSLAVNTVTTGSTSPTSFTPNGKPFFSWDEAAIQITRDGASWGTNFGSSAVVTYAFRSTAPGAMPDDTSGFSRFTAAQISVAEAALASWAAVANITFVRVQGGDGYSNNASILFGNYTTGAAGASAFAFLPVSANISAASEEGDVWINNSLADNNDLSIGGFGRHVLLHEIGHALGLTHPGEYNAAAGVSITYPADAEYYNDARMFTAMSYFGSSNTGGTLPGFASIPQLHDIAAIQRLYGANMASRVDDTVYGFNSNTGIPAYSLTLASQGAVFAIWDGGGKDTIDLSGYASNSTIDLREEAFSSAGPDNGGAGSAAFNISIARSTVIENAIGGSGNDTFIGNAADNNIQGNGGDDAINGGSGMDTSVYAGLASTAATWVRTPDGSWTINGGPQGIDILNAVEFLDFADRDVFLDRAASTFTGDGTSDIIVRNTMTGGLAVWFLASGIITTGGLGTVDASWQVQGVGDFTGDGRDDIIWRNSGGGLAAWFMNGAASTGAVLGSASAASTVETVGDFNGDGTDDVLWRESGGGLAAWFFNKGVATGGVLGSATANWIIEGAADFNGDGRDDFLWRDSSSGALAAWFMNGTSATGGVLGQVDAGWTVQGLGDFNGDGRDDILWRNSADALAVWFMNGTSATGGVLGQVGGGWTVQSVGDYNGDGRDDILWRNGDIVAAWYMNGTLADGVILSSLSTDWVINPYG